MRKRIIIITLLLGWFSYLFSHESEEDHHQKSPHSQTTSSPLSFEDIQQKNPHYHLIEALFQIELEKFLATNEGYCSPFTWTSTLYELFPNNKTLFPHNNDPVIIHQCFDHSKSIGVYLSEYFRDITCAKKTGAHFLGPPLIDVDADNEEDFDQDPRHHHNTHHPHPYSPTSSTEEHELEHNPYTKASHQLRWMLLENLPKRFIHPAPNTLDEQAKLKKQYCSCQTLYDCLQDSQSAFQLEKLFIVEIMTELMAKLTPLVHKYTDTMINLDYDEISLPSALFRLLPSLVGTADNGTSSSGGAVSVTSEKKRRHNIVVDFKEDAKEPSASASSLSQSTAAPSFSTTGAPEWLKELKEPLNLPVVPDITIYYHCDDDVDPHVSSAGILSFTAIAQQLEYVLQKQSQSKPSSPSKPRRNLRAEYDSTAPSSASNDHSNSESAAHHIHIHEKEQHDHHSTPPTTSITTSTGKKYQIKYIYLLCESGKHVLVPKDYHRYPLMNHNYMKCSMMTQWLFLYLQQKLDAFTSQHLQSRSERYVLILKRNSNYILDYLRLSSAPIVISSLSSFSFFPLLLNNHEDHSIYLPAIPRVHSNDSSSALTTTATTASAGTSILSDFSHFFHSMQSSKSFSFEEVIYKPNPWRLIYFTLLEQPIDWALCDAFVIQGKGKSVYLVKNKERHEFNSGEDFEKLGYQWGEVMRVDNGVLNSIPLGSAVTA